MTVVQPLRILFVEDSEDDKELVLHALSSEFPCIVHQRVDCAATLRAALTQQEWDLVISDHGLPALNAPAALRIVQETHADTPFVIVSGSMPEEVAAEVMSAGAADMLNKSNLSRLVPAVQRELKKRAEMSALRQVQVSLRQESDHDGITGLRRPAALAQRLEERGPAARLALLVLDINRFELVRHSLGMQASEDALRAFAARLNACAPAGADAAHLGGERFALLLPAHAAHEAEQTIERLNVAAGAPLAVAGRDLFLAFRAGVAMYPADGHDFHTLLVHAEIAMGQVSPGNARNYRFFEAGMNAAGRGRLALEQALHRALQNEEFVLHYQPQVDARDGRIIGAEALLRWRQPDGTQVSPAEFIPLLEETGLIVPVGEWVLRTACRQNRAWQQAGHPPLRIAVNLSAVQFRQAELVPMVGRILDETGLAPGCLELEITENAALHNEEAVITTLGELRAMGISLAIDDFGTGYSSLGYLRRFPVHRLKIDRSFVKDITEVQPESAIARAIISLAHNLRLEVVAEGVETQRQSGFLLSWGCASMQGYLYGRPVPAEMFWR